MIYQVIEQYIQRHELFLEEVLNSLSIPADTIRSAAHYTLFPGGKRIRPLLTYLTGQLIDLDLNTLDVIAAAIEFTHCYSLIHDDLPAMDNDDFRRGKPSCHKQFDEATAILVGDGMQALAIEVLLAYLPPLLNAEQVVAVSLELVKASGMSGMVSGQSLDLSELSQSLLSETQLKEVHFLKTGKLISACVEMVLAAKKTVSEPIKSGLRTYANHLGLVFQIQDDYLDYYASANLLGKGRSSDIANNKTTFATFYSREKLEQEITHHYQMACNALKIFDKKAEALLMLTHALEERSHLQ